MNSPLPSPSSNRPPTPQITPSAMDVSQQLAEHWDRMEQPESQQEPQQAEQEETPHDLPLEERGEDRRAWKRHGFPAIQRLAPYRGVRAPEPSAWREVRCQDISQGGISFFWPELPDFEDVLIALRGGAGDILLKARVLRSSPMAGPHNEFLVCCQLLERVTAY